MLSVKDRKELARIDKNAKYPSGLGKIDRNECPLGYHSPAACMICSCGHMLECHFPKSCEEAECSHYEREINSEY